jgi:hypothetical protein
MFWRKPKFEPDGYYDGYGYKVVGHGKVDVDLGDRIVHFSSIEEMVANLDHAGARRAADLLGQPASEPVAALPVKKGKPGCGCLVLILIGFAIFYFAGGNPEGKKIADIINTQFGRVCEAKVEGIFSSTLRLDWTTETTKLNVITVMAAIGKTKESLYSKGIRYLKFPNEAGGYNIIDWKTGEKTSVSERAPYYFRN